jgi:hypothetical protein
MIDDEEELRRNQTAGLELVVDRCSFFTHLTLCSPSFSFPLKTYSYGQETFTRFIKDVVKAADENKDGIICVKEVEHLLTNIGAHDALTPEEIKHIMEDLGCADHLKQSDDTGIPATRVVDFFHLEATPASPPPSALSSSSSSNNSKKA